MSQNSQSFAGQKAPEAIGRRDPEAKGQATAKDKAVAKGQPGTLVYVMGPSGAGKDSLIEAALATKLPSLIAIPRLVTRASSPESHDSQVTPEYFLELERRNRLSLSWASHGYLYGLEKTLEDELAKGQVVIVNGSRQYLPEAKRRFPALKAVLITAEEKILKARLEKRARENASSIEERLSRTNESLIEPDADLVVIDNSKTLQNALEPFLELLKGHWPIQSPES